MMMPLPAIAPSAIPTGNMDSVSMRREITTTAGDRLVAATVLVAPVGRRRLAGRSRRRHLGPHKRHRPHRSQRPPRSRSRWAGVPSSNRTRAAGQEKGGSGTPHSLRIVAAALFGVMSGSSQPPRAAGCATDPRSAARHRCGGWRRRRPSGGRRARPPRRRSGR